MTFQAFDFINHYAPLLMQGAFMTVQLWLSCMMVALCIGMVWGVVRSNKLRVPGVSLLLDSVVFVLKGVPFYVQLLIAYFALPALLGINISAFAAAVLSLGLCSAAYISQIVRGGMNSIATGQWEASFVLGFSTVQTLRVVIIPQVVRTVLPMLGSELDQLLKSTAIISSIGVLELTRAGMNIIARDMNPLPVYACIALMYLAVSSLLNVIFMLLERRFNYVAR